LLRDLMCVRTPAQQVRIRLGARRVGCRALLSSECCCVVIHVPIGEGRGSGIWCVDGCVVTAMRRHMPCELLAGGSHFDLLVGAVVPPRATTMLCLFVKRVSTAMVVALPCERWLVVNSGLLLLLMCTSQACLQDLTILLQDVPHCSMCEVRGKAVHSASAYASGEVAHKCQRAQTSSSKDLKERKQGAKGRP
jgi:hypothetical protein